MIKVQKRYLTVLEVSEYLGFSVSAIRKWVRLGSIPFCKVNGGIRFDIRRIDTWTQKCAVNSLFINDLNNGF